MELLEVVSLHRDLYTTLVLVVTLLSHLLKMEVGSATEPLEISVGMKG